MLSRKSFIVFVLILPQSAHGVWRFMRTHAVTDNRAITNGLQFTYLDIKKSSEAAIKYLNEIAQTNAVVQLLKKATEQKIIIPKIFVQLGSGRPYGS